MNISKLKDLAQNKASLKGCGMGPLLALVSPCLRENVVVTCKLGIFCVI